MDRLDVLVGVLEAARRWPRMARAIGEAVGTAADLGRRVPILGRAVPPWLSFAPRAILGGSGLALHRANRAKGEITLGGARNAVLGIGWFRAFHEVARERLGEAGAVPVLYEIGRRGGLHEVQEMKRTGQWFPPPFDEIVGSGRVLSAIRSDPRAERAFQLLVRQLCLLVLSDGGLGNLARIDARKDPIEIEIEECAEAKALGPAPKPTCHVYRGLIAGWSKEILGEPVAVEEGACAAAGARRCTFLVRRTAAAAAESDFRKETEKTRHG